MPLFLIREKESHQCYGTVQATSEEDLWWYVDHECSPFSFEYAKLGLASPGENSTVRVPDEWWTFSEHHKSGHYGFGGLPKAPTPDRREYLKDVKDFGAFPSANPKNPRNGLVAK